MDHVRGERMSIWLGVGRFIAFIFYSAPWAWLIAFAIFAISVTVEVGHFPAYSNPDPKHVPDLEVLYMAVVVLLGLAVLSPAIVALHVLLRAILYPAWPMQLWRLAVYALGAGLGVWVIYADPAGLTTWLFD